MLAVFAFAALLATQVPSELVVRVEVRDSDPCDLASRVPTVLAELLRGVQIVREEGEGRAPNERMRLLAIAGSGGVHLELFDEAGRSVLARDVPNPRDACAGTADGIALIVERYLRDLGYEPSPVPPLPVETATKAAVSPSPAPPGAIATATVSQRVISFGFGVGAGGVVALGVVRPSDVGTSKTVQTSPALHVHASFGIDWLEVSLSGAWIGPSTSFLSREGPDGGTLTVGTLSVSSFAGAIGAGVCVPVGTLRLCPALELGVEGFRGRATAMGMASTGLDTAPRWVWSLLTGGEIRLDIPVWRWVFVSPSAGILVRPSPPSFATMEINNRYDASTLALTFGLAAWVRL